MAIKKGFVEVFKVLMDDYNFSLCDFDSDTNRPLFALAYDMV